MIKRVRLRAFKSITNSETVDLAPLTILSGANSTGKSTLLQSILLLSQTLSSKATDRALLLNGGLVRLGTFDQVRAQSAKGRKFAIGLDVDLRQYGPVQQSAHGWEGTERAPGRSSTTRTASLDLQFSKLSKTNAQMEKVDPRQPVLDFISLTIEQRSDMRDEGRSVSVRAQRVNRLEASPGPSSPRTKLGGSSYDVVVDEESTAELERRSSALNIMGMVPHHFLPKRLVVQSDPALEQANDWILGILALEYPSEMGRSAGSVAPFPGELIERLVRIVKKVGIDASTMPEGQFDAEEWRSWLNHLDVNVKARLRRALLDAVDDIGPAALRASQLPRMQSLLRPLPAKLSIGVERLDNFLSSKVKYLGPLREEPKPVYALSGEADHTSVGTKGEFTAAVLSANRDVRITYVEPPKALDSGRHITRGTLGSAVNQWLEYLGVAAGAEASDLGAQGHDLKIRHGSLKKPVDLTQVGVGVSQLLPVVVMCLLAPRGSVLILEQPELHMHPRVQALLADFFLAVTASGAQCLVETHSEYLISRLRLRVAESVVKPSGDVAILFAETNSGQTRYRSLQLNAYGSIEEWPDGFFDTSSKESAAILMAAMRKKRQRKLS